MIYNSTIQVDPWDSIAEKAFYESGGITPDIDIDIVIMAACTGELPVVNGPDSMSLEEQWKTIEYMMEMGFVPKCD